MNLETNDNQSSSSFEFQYERKIITLCVSIYGSVGLLSFFWLWWREELNLLVGNRPLQMTIYGIVVGVGIVGAWKLSTLFFEQARYLEQSLSRELGPISLKTTFILAFFSSIGEELFFRGVIQPQIGLWWTALIFGVLHIPFRKEMFMWPIFAFLMGLFLGWSFEFSGSLIFPIMVHFVNNWINLWLMSKKSKNSIQNDQN